MFIVGLFNPLTILIAVPLLYVASLHSTSSNTDKTVNASSTLLSDASISLSSPLVA